jgi:hypothetical protein
MIAVVDVEGGKGNGCWSVVAEVKCRAGLSGEEIQPGLACVLRLPVNRGLVRLGVNAEGRVTPTTTTRACTATERVAAAEIANTLFYFRVVTGLGARSPDNA